MKVFFSVVSHGHESIIRELDCISNLCQEFTVVLKSNKSGDDFHYLMASETFHWIDSDYGLGFGHNNNKVYSYCKDKLGMKEHDIFVVLNPDVLIDIESVRRLIFFMKKDKNKLCAINLFKDRDLQVFDNSIREFPCLNQFVKSFLGFGNSSIIDKALIDKPTSVDWAAGSFLAFKANLYQSLGGFDEGYFMYCEDIDICFRSKKAGFPVVYYPEVRALHLAKHANRSLFSMHLYWHVSSVIRFLCSKSGLVKAKSKI
ncbi:glycosyl transferase family 2 [Photobacterium swingsii]|uniref:Glycosyltransferase family 2 protein n=1 Tax=Photobacterium swingsii TaxID=680026 RepID=A0A0J8VAF7_9GAMM|nr:glycosyltransferase family 2 protein [Photobacterium swingsii]KMV30236.1 glycosyl transferase family 2 [Photobacterium swingsii]PSW23299.1 glycosyltransferase family 2 protein [Photobacterium swingsii]